MRILVMNWKDMAHPNAGGAEVYTYEVTKAWAAEGHEVTWFCAAVTGKPERETIEGVSLIRRGSRFGVYRAARTWYRHEGRGNFDVVVDEVNTKPFGAVRYVRDVPVVALIHQVCREIWWHEMPLPIAALGRFILEPYWLRSYAHTPVLTVSESSRESLATYGLKHMTILPEGIGSRNQPTVRKESRPTVIFVGRMTSSKRPADVIAAMRLLRESMPTAQLWMIGSGPELQKLTKSAPADVIFYGRVDDATKQELMARAHVLAVTSVREGWGLVVDEAAALGTTAVAYDVAGLRDSTVPAQGQLVPSPPEALAAGLRVQLAKAVEVRAAAGWQGGAVSWEQVADAFMRQIVRIIMNSKR